MKLTNIYNKLIVESLIAEDRNQAKALLKKAGVTSDKWKLKPEFNADSDESKVLDTVLSIGVDLRELNTMGDLGFWTQQVLDYWNRLKQGGSEFKELSTNHQDDIKRIYNIARELKLNPIDELNECCPGDVIISLSNGYNDLQRKWCNWYINEFIPKEIKDVLSEEGGFKSLFNRLKDQSYDESTRKLLVKMHRKLRRFMPIDTDGNERDPEYVFGIIDFISNVTNVPEYGTDSDMDNVKKSSDVIWEGKDQLIIQITKDGSINDKTTDDKSNKACHGAESWCIIYDPEEYWNSNAGLSTFKKSLIISSYFATVSVILFIIFLYNFFRFVFFSDFKHTGIQRRLLSSEFYLFGG